MPKYANMLQVQGVFAPRASQIFLCLCLATRILHLMTQRLGKKQNTPLKQLGCLFQFLTEDVLALSALPGFMQLILNLGYADFSNKLYFQIFFIKQASCYRMQGFISDSITKTIIFIICYQTAILAGTWRKHDTNFPRK